MAVGLPELSDCRPGLRATGFAMVVAVAETPEKRNGIIMPDSVRDKDRMTEVKGRIVSMSPACFDFANFPPGTAPRVGDAVQFARLSGVMTTGADGREYRLLQDKDVLAIVEEG